MLLEDMGEAGCERLFYNLLLRVGAMGKYQYICIVVWGIICMLSASIMFLNPFLFYQAPYNCKDISQNQCSNMVCSLPQELRFGYIDNHHPTFIDKFGDYRCNSSYLKLIQSIIYIAGLLGIILATHINTYVRKKVLLQASLAISIFCLSMLFIVDSLFLAIVLICINLTCHAMIADILPCFPTEIIMEEKRGCMVTLLFIFYNSGCVFNGLLSKLISWQNLMIFYFITPIVVSLVVLIFYVKETPFDLVTIFTPQEAHRDLHWIAEQNGNADSHQITIQELQLMRKEYEENMRTKQQADFHIFDLFKFKSLRMDTICCCALHFFIYYSYSSPLLLLDQFGLDIYTNDILFSLASLSSSILCLFLVDRFPRKMQVYCSIIISLFFIIPHYLSSNCTENCEGLKTAETAGIFCFRVLMEIAYQILYFIQNELFPTQVRSLAILLTAIMANVVPIFIPLIASINETYNFTLPVSYVISAGIIVLATSQIRQTFGIPPPEIIQELAYVPSKKPN